MYELIERANRFMDDLLKVANEIDATISTMTVMVKFANSDGEDGLDLDKVLRGYVADNVQVFLEAVCGSRDAITTSVKKPFRNSIVFKTKGIPIQGERVLGKQSVKIFCNGNMHITGVKDVRDALYLAEVFAALLELVYGGTGGSGMFQMTGYDVQLINFYLSIPCGNNKHKGLDLRKVQEVLTKKTPYYVCYNTERHPGVIVKAVDFTLMVFDSLNILISSVKSVEQLVSAKEFVTGCVFPLIDADSCCIDKPLNMSGKAGKRKVDEAFDYSKYIVLK
jgi:TATA-box binding protein (TBP) (component of TFIID and TFIIIB)